jgi:hypothetical protein
MTLSHDLHSNRVCSEVPGGKGAVSCSIGRPLSISTVPIASDGDDGDPRPRGGLSANAETTKRGSGVPIPSAALRFKRPGNPRERYRTADRWQWDDDLLSGGRGSAEKSCRRLA